MLVIDYNQTDSTPYEVRIHVGAGKTKKYVGRFGNGSPDLLVQADGDELEAVKAQFTNIPIHNGRVVMWTGETALFIINNLRL